MTRLEITLSDQLPSFGGGVQVTLKINGKTKHCTVGHIEEMKKKAHEFIDRTAFENLPCAAGRPAP
jgi:hypothetical protein